MNKVRAGVNTTGITEHFKNLTPVYGSALTSERYNDAEPTLPHFGRLPAQWQEQFMADRQKIGIDYVIFSYGTPIAWHLTNGDWAKPNVKYSPTTSKHQGKCPRMSQGYLRQNDVERSA